MEKDYSLLGQELSPQLSLLLKKEVFAFDFDGVLLDSVNIKTKAFASLYQCHGAEVVSKVIQYHEENGGVSRNEKFKYFHRYYLNKKLGTLDLVSLSEKFSALVVKDVIAANWICGAESFLSLLKKLGKECIVVSATPQEELELIIDKRNMCGYFSRVYGAPKLKNRVLENVIVEKGINPRSVVFFGDALVDWRAAEETGVDFVGVGNQLRDLLPIGSVCPVCIQDFDCFFS